MIFKISPLLKYEVLVVFVNLLTVDEKYLVREFQKLQFPIQLQYLKNEIIFLNLLFHFGFLIKF